MRISALLLVLPLVLANCQADSGFDASQTQSVPMPEPKTLQFTQWKSPEVAQAFYARATGKLLGAAKSNRGSALDICSSASMLRLIRSELELVLLAQEAVVDSTLGAAENEHRNYCVEQVPESLLRNTMSAVSSLSEDLNTRDPEDELYVRAQADFCMAVNQLADMQSRPYTSTSLQVIELQKVLGVNQDQVVQHCPFSIN